MLGADEIERLLVVTAHPDDVDFGAAGTVAVLTDQGVRVTYCLVTDGQAGGFDDSIPRPKMAAIRREEQTAAAAHARSRIFRRTTQSASCAFWRPPAKCLLRQFIDKK